MSFCESLFLPPKWKSFGESGYTEQGRTEERRRSAANRKRERQENNHLFSPYVPCTYNEMHNL
jgi:hypothetical protein